MRKNIAIHQMRGNKVAWLSDSQILSSVEVVAPRLGITSLPDLKDIVDLFDLWEDQFGLIIDIVDDKEWGPFTNGHFSPTEMTIRLPERILKEITSPIAKIRNGGLRVLFHELGHFALAHKAVLHDDNTPPCKEIDAEEQADLFSAYMLQIVCENKKQLTLF